MAENALLEVQGVSKHFGGLVAVDQISFTLRHNEVLGLIGPNGTGKPTMHNLISGALTPTMGERFMGDTLLSERPAQVAPPRGAPRHLA